MPLCYLRFGFFAGLGAVRFAGAFAAGRFPAGFAGGRFPVGLGGSFAFPCLGGIARIRHLGPEPIKSSRWAFIKASRTK